MLDRMLLSAGAADEKLYVEDVFSTWLYTGNGSTQTITNGIDLAGKGGLTWIKPRSAAGSHYLFDTARGVNQELNSDTQDVDTTLANSLTAFNANGFSIGSNSAVNTNGTSYASWTFRKAPKFFDIVTYTGNGVSGRKINHNLGVAPGCVIVKCTSPIGFVWTVYHKNLTSADYALTLNTIDQQFSLTNAWNSTAPTSTNFTLGNNSWVNGNGYSYVAYLFADDTAADSFIKCGVFSQGASVDLGWEPQWVLAKPIDVDAPWLMLDNMRGFSAPVTSGFSARELVANTGTAESTNTSTISSTGFKVSYASAGNYIYIAIRRGPMKTPTLGTNVFMPVTASTPASPYTVQTGFPVDAVIGTMKNVIYNNLVIDRLRGSTATAGYYLVTNNADYENSSALAKISMDSNTSIIDNNRLSGYGYNPIWWNFRRAPNFFDQVCYTGTSAAQSVAHNLGAPPELMLVKFRYGNLDWRVYAAPLGSSAHLQLNGSGAASTGSSVWNNTTPTSTAFTVGLDSRVNNAGSAYVAYLFASCPGVSKVGTYTGNGSSQTINCGFSSGARFFLVKRTDSTGDWWVWDSARGIVTAADPALRLNSAAAEVTSADAVDTASTGIIVNQETTCNINVNGATYIFLAVA